MLPERFFEHFYGTVKYKPTQTTMKGFCFFSENNFFHGKVETFMATAHLHLFSKDVEDRF